VEADEGVRRWLDEVVEVSGLSLQHLKEAAIDRQ